MQALKLKDIKLLDMNSKRIKRDTENNFKFWRLSNIVSKYGKTFWFCLLLNAYVGEKSWITLAGVDFREKKDIVNTPVPKGKATASSVFAY